jgi:hypothetical protein
MDKLQSHKIVKDTFQNQFNKDRFVFFISNLLNHYDKATFIYRGNFIPDAYEKYISTLERVGKYSDGEHKIDILIVNLKKETSIERARTMQRNFIAWYLNGSRGNEMKDAAIVAFVSPNQEDWRFSLVKMDYKFEENNVGKMKVKEEFTPARRWSYLVGKNENSHTAQSRLAPLVEDDKNNLTLKQLEEAFNIEKVTKEFFEKYRELFLWTKDTIEDVISKDAKLKNNFETQGVNIIDFAKKLLGQIVFLYFLQKKGWFGVERDSNWGTGPKNFLRQLFESKHGKYKNFFNDILEPLFYEALARERADDFYSRFNCKIPFLNGGLFDPINNYDWVHTDLILPNDLFSNKLKTKQGDIGTGILDIFDRYNFTVKEDEPLEKEVAVDPEMLGKVFENLLEVKDRKSKGTYYTPREIVHYMCQQSLINYLITELKDKVGREDIEKLIKFGDSVAENEARVGNKGEETQKYSYKLPASIRKNAQLVDDKLASIKVCDPAIGSGAFPVGMMNEIVQARSTLNAYLCDNGNLQCKNRTPYDFKFECIQNSIYGVDIDPGAVEIAKLRLWLSLVVDEDDIKQIKPLPNLDYKIMQGNSLLEEYEGIKLFDENIIPQDDSDKEKQITSAQAKIADFQRVYFRLHSGNQLSGSQKIILEKQIKEQQKLINLLTRKVKTGSAINLFEQFDRAKMKWDELKNLHKLIVNECNKEKKDNMLKRANQLEWEFIEETLRAEGKSDALEKIEQFKNSNIKPFFLWKLHFPEVFQGKGGFDVIIANPPYIRHRDLDKNFKDALKNAYKTGNTTSDTYCYFYELSYNLLCKEGVSSFITSNKWMRAKYGQNLRVFFKENTVMLQIIDLGLGQFISATVDTNILIFEKQTPSRDHQVEYAFKTPASDEQNLLKILQNQLEDGSFTLTDSANLKLKGKIERIGIPLSQQSHLKINYGILTGKNEIKTRNGNEGVFIINKKTRDDLISRDSKSSLIIHPVLRGRDVSRYLVKWSGKYIIAMYYGSHQIIDKFPAIKNHLYKYRKSLESRAQVRRGDHHWLELDQNPSKRYIEEFEHSKIIYPEISSGTSFTYDDSGYFHIDTVFHIVGENLKFLLGLNSKLACWLIRHYGSVLGDTGFRFKKIFVEKLPIPTVSDEVQKLLTEIVDKILIITKSSDYLEDPTKQAKVKEYERQIDRMVYKLYDLTEKEIQTIESSNKE